MKNTAHMSGSTERSGNLPKFTQFRSGSNKVRKLA